MKFFGEKSVSSLVYKLLYGILVIIIFITLLSTLVGIVMLLKKPELYKNFIQITLNFKSEYIPKVIWGFGMLIWVGLQIGLLKITLNLFNNFRKNIIFDKKNVEMIKNVSYMKLYSLLIPVILGPLTYGVDEKGVVKFSFDGIESVLLIIVFFMIALALEEAIKYKEENELTV